ncbi:MAG: ATP-binding cassette domain-containing protein, partial [Sciscionella sp.]
RMMCGLTPPTSGGCHILGRRYVDIPNPSRQVGVLLDASAQHSGRTGREVLKIGAIVMGLDDARVDAMMQLVGLTPTEGRRRVGNYSLGMRQRLGVAHALLGDPKVLVLDEPANGLDPAGIRWMRDLLRTFADRGGTVLLSSHLLSEIQVIADELVIIGRGRIVAQGSKDDLLKDQGTTVRGLDKAALAGALKAAGLTYSDDGSAGFSVQGTPEQVGRAAAAAGAVLVELGTRNAALEDMFLNLTASDAREGVPA